MCVRDMKQVCMVATRGNNKIMGGIETKLEQKKRGETKDLRKIMSFSLYPHTFTVDSLTNVIIHTRTYTNTHTHTHTHMHTYFSPYLSHYNTFMVLKGRKLN
jgi:hypothetical protein